MDTQADFIFLIERVADKFNPLQNGEYLVIQICAQSLRLHPLHRGFDYLAARSFCEFENLSSDYSIRIVQQGKLHHVNASGLPTQQSKEQDWKIHEHYYNARFSPETDCDIEVCNCSYPVFWSDRSVIARDGETRQAWLPVTCLVEDFGREVNYCPNCNSTLVEEVEPEEVEDEDCEEVPTACVGCRYYNSDSLLACAIHPLGVDETVEICPDYSQQP